MSAGDRQPGAGWGGGRAFTLIEMLVTLAIIALILGIGIPVLSSVRSRAAGETARGLVNAVAAAIAGYQTKAWTMALPAAGPGLPMPTLSLPMWDCNRDGLLDGDPAKDGRGRLTAAQHQVLIDSGYRGFFAMAQPTVARRLVKEGRVLDPWGTPLRIGWAADVYGVAGYGVWSAGADRQDAFSDGVADAVAADRDNVLSWDVGAR